MLPKDSQPESQPNSKLDSQSSHQPHQHSETASGTQAGAEPAGNCFNISHSHVTNLTGSGNIYFKASDTPRNRGNQATPLSGGSSVPSIEGQNRETSKKTILFLAANPLGTQPLRLDKEVREIEAGLRRSQYRDRFDLRQRWALRPRDLQRAMLDCHPHIVHFSGHGTSNREAPVSRDRPRDISIAQEDALTPSSMTSLSEAGLILEDATGRPQQVSAEALAALFALFADSVECVLLNACYSKQQADAIAMHVPIVIAMNQAISDHAAIEFAIGFYDALGAGMTIPQAYQQGVVALKLAGLSEATTPKIIRQAR